MILKSDAFKGHEFIPRVYTREGDDISPSLSWFDAPKNTKSFVLICEDPDAKSHSPFYHWLVYNIPADVNGLPMNLSHEPTLGISSQFNQGLNSYEEIGYGGPLPPREDKAHRYRFRLFALDVMTQIPPGSTAEVVKDTIRGHIIAETELLALYARHNRSTGRHLRSHQIRT